MGVIVDLLSVKEDEHGGETAFDRLDFQTSWGIGRVVTLHSAPGHRPYAVAFEFHEDVAEVDDPANPSFLRLYQVKTKKAGNWTLGALAKRVARKGAATKPSFVGRMHSNLAKFAPLAEKTVFVSNRPLTEANGTAGEFSLGRAERKVLDKFLGTLRAELPTFSDDTDLPRFRFLDSGLHLDTYDATVIGQIALFLAEQVGGDVDAKQFYLTLGFECRKRSKHLADLSSMEDLVASKFVTRADVEADLERIRHERVRLPKWTDVAPALGLNHRAERDLRQSWRDYELEFVSRPTPATRRLAESVAQRVVPIIDVASTLLEGARDAGDAIRPELEAALGPRSTDFCVAAALYEYSR